MTLIKSRTLLAEKNTETSERQINFNSGLIRALHTQRKYVKSWWQIVEEAVLKDL